MSFLKFSAELKKLRIHYMSAYLLIALFALTNVSLSAEPSTNPHTVLKEANQQREIDAGIQELKKTAKGFSAVAKQAIPAVVFIKTEYKNSPSDMRASPFGAGPQDLQSPLDLFNDEFFQRFFGMSPKREREDMRQRPMQMAQGSGFIVTEDGYILTNAHVVNEADKIIVVLNDEREIEAKVIGIDVHTDLAVIKIEEKKLPFVSLGDSDALEIGDWVVAIGNPVGLQASLTVGVVSAKGRSLDLSNITDFIQTDAAIYHGNSGGPLLNLDGQVIGINTAIATTSMGGYFGVGFAIPSNIAKRVTDKLISKGNIEHGFLGVIMQPLHGELAEYYRENYKLDPPKGALVKEVVKGSPAEKAGLQPQDIITQCNDQSIDNLHALSRYIKLLDPGTTIKMVVNRKGTVITLKVQLGASPDNITSSKTVEKLGLHVTELTKDLAKRLGYKSEEGVVVERVEPCSAAGRSRLVRRGSLITAVNQQPVTSVAQFNQAVEEAMKSSKRVLMTVKDGENSYFIALKFE